MNPDPAIPPAVQALLDKQSIYEVLMRYCRGIDRRDAALVRGVYHPDAVDEHALFDGPADAFVEFVMPLLDGMGTQHLIGNVLVELDGDRAYSEASFVAFHQKGGGVPDVTVGGRYLDRFERRQGEWKIAHRRVLMDWNRNDPDTSEWKTGLCGGLFRHGRQGPEDDVFRLRTMAPDRRG